MGSGGGVDRRGPTLPSADLLGCDDRGDIEREESFRGRRLHPDPTERRDDFHLALVSS